MEIKVLKDILSVNEQMAQRNRSMLDSKGVFMMNVMSSPGSGKTSLILETVRRLKDRLRIGVVEGDISSSIDAEKIGRENVPVVQINTGGECHLDAGMISRALDSVPLEDIDLLFIENVGNLVCPGEFNLGEHRKIIILSVPEGDDKIYKYPLMFNIADVVVVNKVDLLPYTSFDFESFSGAVKGINQKAQVLQVSCTTGQGMDDWIAWITGCLQR
jgi:hydrogenase nickel incorporation protein HypB